MNLFETVLALQEGWIALNESVESLERSNAELNELAQKMREQGDEVKSQAQRFEQANSQLEAADQERTREVRLIVNRVAEHYSAVVAAADRTDKLAALVTESLTSAQQYQLAAQQDRKSTEEQAAQITRTGLEIANASADVKVVKDAIGGMRDHIAQERKHFERLVADVTKEKITDLGRSLRGEIDEHVTRALERLTATKVNAFRWRGPWKDTDTYEPGDLFTAFGNSYIVLRRSIGVPPTEEQMKGKSPRYGLMAAGGANGLDLRGDSSGGGASVAAITVANDTARFSLTSAQAPVGTIVTVTATGLKWLVVDSASLSTSAGYSVLNPTGDSQIQFRRGTTAECNAITPADGEPVWDLTLDKLRIGDGTTLGGVRRNITQISDVYAEDSTTKKSARGIITSGSFVQFQLYDENSLGFAPENSSSFFPGGFSYSSIAGSTNGIIIYGLDDNSTRIPTDKGLGTSVEVLPQDDVVSTTALAKTNTTFEEANIGFAVYSGKAYSFEIEVIVTAAAGGGHKYKLDGDAVIATMEYTIESLNLTTGLFTITDRKTALASSSGNTNVSLGTMRTTIKGTISDVTTTGSVNLSFAQNTAVGTSTLLAGGARRIRFATVQ